MSVKPIIFSAPMVRALLDGRKTQTRRLVKPPRAYAVQFPLLRTDVIEGGLWWWDGVHERVGASAPMPYQPGDLLYVREAFAQVGNVDPPFTTYRATYPRCLPPGLDNVPERIEEAGYRWRPSIHLPRRLSRLTLRVTAVKVERLNEISEADAKAEAPDDRHSNPVWRERFWDLWDRLHGPGSWDANPEVVAISFVVIRANVDKVDQ